MSAPSGRQLQKRRSQPTLPTIPDEPESTHDADLASNSSTVTTESSSEVGDPKTRRRQLRKVNSMPDVLDEQLLQVQYREASQLVRRDSKSKENPRDTLQQLLLVARDFDSFEPFSRQNDGSYPYEIKCLFCKHRSISTIFFPCQHKCVCNSCIRRYEFGVDTRDPKAWTLFPVCMNMIRLMLPHEGKEGMLYWRWVSKSQPILPMFMSDDEPKPLVRRSSRSASVVVVPTLLSLQHRPPKRRNAEQALQVPLAGPSPGLEARTLWPQHLTHQMTRPRTRRHQNWSQ